MAFDPRYFNAIAGIESDATPGGGYGALGPTTKSGDRAHGRYQIMGANIGPWTKKYLGQEMTPEEFRANPAAQDKVFEGEFGRLVDKYGPEGAARAWFAGEGGMNTPAAADVNGMTVDRYGKAFTQNLNRPTLPDGTPITDSQYIGAAPGMNAPAPGAQSIWDGSAAGLQRMAEQAAQSAVDANGVVQAPAPAVAAAAKKDDPWGGVDDIGKALAMLGRQQSAPRQGLLSSPVHQGQTVALNPFARSIFG